MVNITCADGEFNLDEDTKLTFTSWEGQMQYCIGRSFKTKKGDVFQLRSSVVLTGQEWDCTIRDILKHRGQPLHKRPRLDVDLCEALVVDERTPCKNVNDSDSVRRRLSFSDVLKPTDPSRFHLGRDRYVTANTFNDVQYVHVRVHTIKGDQLMPTSSGIALTLQQWNELVKCKVNVTESVHESAEEYTHHLGSGRFVTVTSYPENQRLIHIRQYWKPVDSPEPIPTKKGITLSPSEWENICDVFTKLPDIVSELHDVKSCWAQDDHQNQLGALQCTECNPFECHLY
jgi:hypothetical protein